MCIFLVLQMCIHQIQKRLPIRQYSHVSKNKKNQKEYSILFAYLKKYKSKQNKKSFDQKKQVSITQSMFLFKKISK